MCNQRVKIEILDEETQRTSTISFRVALEDPEWMKISIGEILRVGTTFAKTTNLAVPCYLESGPK